MSLLDEAVYGELIGDLLPTIRNVLEQAKASADGQMHFSVSLAPEAAGPLFRALKRAEAELMLEEADSFCPDEDRTPPQRAHDAFFRIAEAIIEEHARAKRHERLRARPARPAPFQLPPDERLG